MAGIVTSIIVKRSPQEDGRVRIEELHTDDAGLSYPHEYLWEEGMNENIVLAKTAELMSASLINAAKELAAAMNFQLPISKLEYFLRFDPQEFEGITAARATNAEVARVMMALDMTTVVYTNHPLVVSSLILFESLGLIAPGRKEVIGA